jgi:hypothetical protein
LLYRGHTWRSASPRPKLESLGYQDEDEEKILSSTLTTGSYLKILYIRQNYFLAV